MADSNVSYQDYSVSKISFFMSHGNDFNVYTSQLSDLGVYYKQYQFRDDSVWYERMSPVTEVVSVCVHGVDVSAEVKLYKTEFWNTDCAKSCFYYEKF